MSSADRALTLIAWACLATAGVFAARPGGVVHDPVVAWWQDREARRLVESEWDQLVSAMTIGAPGDEVRVVEFLDYTCSYCRHAASMLDSLIATNVGGRVAIRHRPRGSIPQSKTAAAAAICAEDAGDFLSVHAFLLTDTRWLTDSDWRRVGRKAGVADLERWMECFDSERVALRLAADRRWADRLHVVGTPTFFTRGSGRYVGVPSSAALSDWFWVVE